MQARGQKRYSSEAHERFVTNMIEACDIRYFSEHATAGLGSRSERPVFVFGLPRSGTSLIEQILASHPEVHGSGELEIAENHFRLLASNTESTGLDIEWEPAAFEMLRLLDRQTIGALTQRHLGWLDQLSISARRVVDKLPSNYLYIGLLYALFPQATFIHCRRDFRDVALSCWMTDFRNFRWADSLEDIAMRISSYRKIMAHWRQTMPGRWLDIDYEETVKKPPICLPAGL